MTDTGSGIEGAKFDELRRTVQCVEAIQATATNGKSFFTGLLNIEDDPRPPQPIFLPNPELMISYAFNFGTELVTVQV